MNLTISAQPLLKEHRRGETTEAIENDDPSSNHTLSKTVPQWQEVGKINHPGASILRDDGKFFINGEPGRSNASIRNQEHQIIDSNTLEANSAIENKTSQEYDVKETSLARDIMLKSSGQLTNGIDSEASADSCQISQTSEKDESPSKPQQNSGFTDGVSQTEDNGHTDKDRTEESSKTCTNETGLIPKSPSSSPAANSGQLSNGTVSFKPTSSEDMLIYDVQVHRPQIATHAV